MNPLNDIYFSPRNFYSNMSNSEVTNYMEAFMCFYKYYLLTRGNIYK